MSLVDFLGIQSDGWDSHMHVVDIASFPLAASAPYRPSAYTLDDALAFEAKLGLGKIVIIQPSFYGFDNSCLLDTLRRLGTSRARGVVVFDPENTSHATLKEWHALGVRGVRLNLQSTSESWDREKIRQVVRRYAEAVKPYGWVMQIYSELKVVSWIADIIETTGVKACFDHFAHPPLSDEDSSAFSQTRDPHVLEGFDALIRLLEAGNTYVKFSAAYRIIELDKMDYLEPIAKEILKVRDGTRVVFGTDWPHTQFEGMDVIPFVSKMLEWVNPEIRSKIFKENAAGLWDIE